MTCRFGDAYKRRRYSTPPRRSSGSFHRLQMPSSEPTALAALRTMAIAAACAPSIHKPLRPPFGHAGQGWVSAAKYARLPRCGCRQLVRGARRAVVRLPRLPATLFCTRSALRHWAAYLADRGARLPGPRGGRASRVPASPPTATTLAHAPTLAARLSLGLVRLLSFGSAPLVRQYRARLHRAAPSAPAHTR